MDGILLLNKPIAWTSHDLVDAVRRKIGQKGVGHAGTLDPMATGLMILLLGSATKRSQEFSGLDKSYRGSIRLGVVTDSWDLEGKILEENPVPDDLEIRIREIFHGFIGAQRLAPPSFSAVRQKGRKVYALARRGVLVEMEPREMQIASLALEAYEAPEIYFDLSCSKGTYVRSIAHEAGKRLGCGAALSSLVRTRIGTFELSRAWSLQEMRASSVPEIEKRAQERIR